MQLFAKHKMSLTISPVSIGNDRYIVNTPLYRLGKTEQYDMSGIIFDAEYSLPRIRAGQSISEVTEIIIPDIREQ
jgi:hypothetical protein